MNAQRRNIAGRILAAASLLAVIGCQSPPARLAIVESTRGQASIPDDPRGLYQASMNFVMINTGKVPLDVLRIRTSASSTITSEPAVPCQLQPMQTIRVSMIATTHDQLVTRLAWVETTNEKLELRVRVDPQALRAGVQAAKESP